MKVKDLISALQGVDGEMDVIVRTSFNVDDGEGWSHDEYEDHDIEDVEQGMADIDNWISPSNKQVIAIYI